MFPKTYFEQNNPQPESGQAFVLMPFADRFQEVYAAIQDTLESPDLNFTCTRADELFGGGHIIEDILQWIGRAEVVIADVTTKNPNVFYELGIAHMVKDVEKVLILTQDMEDVPFDLRPFRCIVYEQSAAGLRQLQRTLTASVKEISEASYRFSVQEETQYQFPHKLFGLDRCFHDFEITEIWVTRDAAKFYLKEYRHILGRPVETAREDSYGVERGEAVPLTDVPWELVLEETNVDTAHFRLVPRR
jgi:hypothetical protein